MVRQRRARPRTIKGVRLGGLLPGESLVTNWEGGEIRRVVRTPRITVGRAVDELPIEETDLGVSKFVPFGNGFALPDPLTIEDVDRAPGLEFHIGIRDGRPCCIGLTSKVAGPPITTTLLKSGALPPIGRLVRETVRHSAVRVVRTASGEVIGIDGLSTPDQRLSWDARTADVDTALTAIEQGSRRWLLTDEHLSEVAAVYKDAY